MTTAAIEIPPDWAEFNFTNAKDSDFSIPFQLTDIDDVGIDLTGYTVTAKLRTEQNSTSAELEVFTVDVTDLATGTVVLTLTDAQTKGITSEHGFYSILYTSPVGIDKTWFAGKITFQTFATET